MKNLDLVNTYLAGCLRSFPITIYFFMLLNLIISFNERHLYDVIIVLIGGFSNLLFLKPLFKSIYNVFGVKKLPLLGLGGRPKGAYSCSDFYNCNDFAKKIESTSFGMPSGHSQVAWTFSCFYITEIWNNNKIYKTSDTAKIFQTIMLLLFSSIMSYYRVYVEGCHTIEQVVMGAIFGGLIGYFGSLYKENLLNYLKKNN